MCEVLFENSQLFKQNATDMLSVNRLPGDVVSTQVKGKGTWQTELGAGLRSWGRSCEAPLSKHHPAAALLSPRALREQPSWPLTHSVPLCSIDHRRLQGWWRIQVPSPCNLAVRYTCELGVKLGFYRSADKASLRGSGCEREVQRRPLTCLVSLSCLPPHPPCLEAFH